MLSVSSKTVDVTDLAHVEPNDLVRRVQNGCNQSATELANRFTPRLLILLERRLSGGRADAEDIAQESLSRAFQEIQNFDFQFKFSTWLYTIAIRRAIDFNRKAKRRPLSLSSDSINEIPSRRDSYSESVAEKVNDLWSIARKVLVESQYSALWLKYGEGLSIQEIAQVLNKTQIGVRVHLHRARTKLSKELNRKDCEVESNQGTRQI